MDAELGYIVESVKTYVSANLPLNKLDSKVKKALELKTPKDLLVIFLNWKSRFVPVQPRSIYESSAFCNNSIRKTMSAEIDKVICEIKTGVDLTPRLSNRVKCGFVLPDPKKSLSTTNRPDLDLLLNDWGIHHLHIALPAADGSVVRGEEIIFVIFKHDKAFLIDIYPHKKWAAKVIVETTVKAWSDEKLFFDLGLAGPINSDGWSDDERSALRNGGFIAPIQVDGKSYAGRGDMSNA